MQWEQLASMLNHEATPSQQLSVQALADWWEAETKAELESVIPKAIEYGSADLKVIGYALSQMIGEPKGVTPDELGIAFYVLGKVARLVGGYADGRKPSDDTWHDIAIYTKMAQFARKHDGWGGFTS